VGGQAGDGAVARVETYVLRAASGDELDVLLSEVGQKISTLRRQRDLTQEQLAQRAGCSTNTVIAVENGKRNVTLRSLALISAAAGVRLAEIFPSIAVSSHKKTSAALAELSEEIQVVKGVVERMQRIVVDCETAIRELSEQPGQAQQPCPPKR